jgi:hypothetical protein
VVPAVLQILSTFGDLCLVLGDKFEKYLDTVKAMLTQAMGLSIHQVGRVSWHWFNSLILSLIQLIQAAHPHHVLSAALGCMR